MHQIPEAQTAVSVPDSWRISRLVASLPPFLPFILPFPNQELLSSYVVLFARVACERERERERKEFVLFCSVQL